MTDSGRSRRATALTLLIDQGGRLPFTRNPAGARALAFDGPPLRHVIGLAHGRLGTQVCERDLPVHVPSIQRVRGGNALIVGVGTWTGDPAPVPARDALLAPRGRPLCQPVRSLAVRDGSATSARTTIGLAIPVGWTLPARRTA